MLSRAHFLISGRVQGVGYRHFAYQEAVGLNLVGFVRNLPNGMVEAIVEGQKDQIQAYYTTLKKGPSFSYVTDVQVCWEEAANKFVKFDVRF